MREHASRHSVPLWASIVLLSGWGLVVPLSALGWRASYLPGSASALALATGGTALPGDMSLTGISPVHVWGSEREILEFGYLRMFGDLAGYGVRWQSTWRQRPLQFLLRSMAEDDIELRSEIPTAEPLALFSARLITATVMRGWRLGATSLGLGLTLAYQRVFEYSARGAWLSAGWQGEPLPWLRWSLTVCNLGAGEALNTRVDPVAPRVGLGLALKTPLWGSYISSDLWYDEQHQLIPSMAWQGSGQVMRLAAGVRWQSETILLTAGFRLTHHRWMLSYAYGYQNGTLGQPHMVSLSREF
ncbi:MAG: hypothetical protein JSW54_07700 [Fidelibacterota bacterium]|nr:MAG: hypothetical protein JSW54_07700 [Candidatus Neomarinimicrobiota bacterium]